MTQPIRSSYWVLQDRLLAGEYPGAMRAAEARDKLEKLVDAGIRSFLDLTESHELIPYDPILREIAAARAIDVRYRRMSVADLGIPTNEHMAGVLEYIETEIKDRRPVYVHCWGGIGRTGTVVGCWMVKKDSCTAEDALQRIVELRRGTPDGRRASPETEEQREFVRQWKV